MFKKVQKGFKKVQEGSGGSRRFKQVQAGSSRFKKV